MARFSQSSGSPEALQGSAMAGGRPSGVGVSCYCPCAWPTLASQQLSPASVLPFPSSLFPTSLSLGPSDCILHSLRPSLDTIPLPVPASAFVWLLVGSLSTEKTGQCHTPVPRSSPLTLAPSGLGCWKLPLRVGSLS